MPPSAPVSPTAAPSPGLASPSEDGLAGRLFSLYAWTTFWYLAGVLVLWLLGVEAIHGHPTPFYALYAPAFHSLAAPGAVACGILVAHALLCRWHYGMPRRRVFLQVITATGLAVFLTAVVYQESVVENQRFAVIAAARWEALRWHLLALGTACGGLAGLLLTFRHCGWHETEWSARATAWFLLGLFVYAAVFACVIAMLREGTHGIAQAYMRQSYEYAGDIGKARDIRDLFARYLELHPYLSMHAKVHPPGPIALLWGMSYFVGVDALALSLATVLFGSLALFPLYGWARLLTNARVARTCCLLYAHVPSIVLFTATSADILFAPFTIGTLFLFERALRHGGAAGWAAAAGAGYACMALLKFSLLAFGAYFAFAGLWRWLGRGEFAAVFRTAAIMLGAFLGVQAAVYWWSGFDIVATFHVAKAQFDLDQHHLDLASPRFPAWSWRILNPLAWFFFAGIPVSLLFIWRLWRPAAAVRAAFLICFLTLCVLNLLYLARGEGERSALYIIPLLVLPAAHLLDGLGARARSTAPLAVTLAFLAFQCWLIESYFYTYW